MHAHIYVKSRKGETLDTFAEQIFCLFNIRDYEMRDSSNYVEERYFRGNAFGIVLEIALADDTQFNDFDFWLTLEKDIKVWVPDKAFLESVADLIARLLTLDGYRVAIDPDCTQKDGPRLIYEINREVDKPSPEQITVREQKAE
jgi:hypothetical protein